MASNVKISGAGRNQMLNGLTSAVGVSGLLRMYDGVQPATPDTAVTNQTLLAEMACSATFAPNASGGVLTLNPISPDSSANNTGVCTWARFTTSAGAGVIDISVGTSGADCNLSPTNTITASGPVSISSAVFTAGNA